MMKKIFLLNLYYLAACLFVSSCSHSSLQNTMNQPKIYDTFTPIIKDNGLKLFTYKTFIWSPSSEQIIDDNSINHHRTFPYANRPYLQTMDIKDFTQQTELGLQKTLEINGFCHKGHVELDRIIENNRGIIRGECLEGATAKDRAKYKLSSPSTSGF